MVEVKFKERLKELRIQNRFLQTQLAKAICVSKDAIHNWETGRSEPSLIDLINLAITLNTSVDYLIGKDEI